MTRLCQEVLGLLLSTGFTPLWKWGVGGHSRLQVESSDEVSETDPSGVGRSPWVSDPDGGVLLSLVGLETPLPVEVLLKRYVSLK